MSRSNSANQLTAVTGHAAVNNGSDVRRPGEPTDEVASRVTLREQPTSDSTGKGSLSPGGAAELLGGGYGDVVVSP